MIYTVFFFKKNTHRVSHLIFSLKNLLFMAIRRELVYATLDKADALTDFDIHNDITKRYEFKKKVILDDESLTMDEKTTAVKILTKDYDYFKILHNEGTKRFCEKCRQECLATLYCEHCIRICLKNNFS